MLNAHIIDGDGTKSPVFVRDNALIVSQFTCPPLLPQKNNIFSQKFTTDGTATGTSEMGVDGSVTPVEYYIPADGDNDRYITRISFVIGYGSSAEGFEFADSNSALTNGVKISYTNTYQEEITIANPKGNYSFMRMSGAHISPEAWEARGFAGAGDYGYFINMYLNNVMPPYGVKLDRGTIQRMSVLIRDDCTDADLFNCQAFGFDRFE